MWIERLKFAAFTSALFIALEAVAFLVIFSSPGNAHEASPAVIDITPLPEQQVMVQLRVEPRAYLARLDGVDHDVYSGLSLDEVSARLSETPPDLATVLMADGRQLAMAAMGAQLDRWDVVVFETSIDSLSITPSAAIGEAVIRVLDPENSAPLQTFFANPGETVRLTDAGAESDAVVVSKYVRSGFDHILPKGLDHILFVVGLFLLSPALRPLVTQVSLFTVAHTATLGLAASGVVSVPAAVVEPLIAASIAFIAVENMFRTSLSRWRPWVVFGFGLLHGLGFASVLSDFGLPSDQFVLALAAFNIGVEIGQLTVLGLCFLAVGLVFRQPWYRSAVSIPASIVLAGVGVFWFVERIAAGMA